MNPKNLAIVKQVREKTGLGLKSSKLCLDKTDWIVSNAVRYAKAHPELGIPRLYE